MTDFGLADAEREICRIADVRAARLVTRPAGPGLAVRVLAVAGRSTDHIVADVRAVALRSTGLLIGRDDVHVVQLEDAHDVDDPGGSSSFDAAWPDTPADIDDLAGTVAMLAPEDPALTLSPFEPSLAAFPTVDEVEPPDETPFRGGRVTLDGVLAVRHGLRYTVEVTLHHEGRARTGSAMGAAASSVILRLVTEATLAALAQIHPAASRLAVETTAVTAAGDRSVALVTLVLLDASHEELLVGSAMVRDVDVHEAVARAALDATNRRLQLQG